ncbi:MAG: dTDP-4-dehydrorhamnose reductase [Methanomassiliicoccales archaeon]|nr:dTDP-4-dehydrorhamnose reductase [Methanomassiliicoccales archaeon]
MRKVLVIGASGLLGQYLLKAGRDLELDMVGTYNETVPTDINGMLRMDITNPDSVSRSLDQICPDLVVLSSAMTNVDQCEREPGKAYAVNMEGAFNVASRCKDHGAKLVYISTDYVFNGLKGSRYHEFEGPDPLSIYGRSKLEGENVTMDADKKNMVCRVSVVYGWNRIGKKSNFLTWIIESLKKGQAIRLYNDQWVSPTYAPSAAKDILELACKDVRGIVHTCGPDCLNRYEMGVMLAEVFGFDKGLISSIETKDMPMLAVRPRASCLAVDIAESELGRSMVGLRQGLDEMKKEER